ncbi:hypothetical protein FB45DRAFT_935707 [Roridomyces roridus]|uniref:Uncharacterized protein n=1 Tax=Roridomyces roridus TaxID=1738132 RepID=A0AAD7BB89_9AGAR|nr:hypothetical protein FB45DRAFT_935707 [Roridomyces roridus]
MNSKTTPCTPSKVWSQRLYVGSPATWMPPMSTNGDALMDDYFASTGPRRQSTPIYHLPFFLLNRNFTGDGHFPGGGLYTGRSNGYYASGFVPLQLPGYHRDIRVYHMSAPSNDNTFSKDKENAHPEGNSKESSCSVPPQALDTPRRQPFILHAPTPEETALEAFREIFGANEFDSYTPRHDARDAEAGRVALPPTPPPPVFIPPSSASRSSSSSESSSLATAALQPESPVDDDADLRAPTPFRFIPALPLRFPGLFASPESDVFDGEGQDANLNESESETESEWEWDEEEATMAIFFGRGVNDDEDDEDGYDSYDEDEDSGLPPMETGENGYRRRDVGLMPMALGGEGLGRRERVRFVLPDERAYGAEDDADEEGDWDEYDGFESAPYGSEEEEGNEI